MLIGSHIQSHLLKTHLVRALRTQGASPATLPASAVAAYDPAGSSEYRVVGAVDFDEPSSQYAATTDLSGLTTEVGNGSACVFGIRLKITPHATLSHYAISFGTQSSTTNWVGLVLLNDESLRVTRNDGASDQTTFTTTGLSGWVSVAIRLNADGTMDIAYLLPGATSVSWANDATTKTITGLDRFAIGALAWDTVTSYYDGPACDAFYGASATCTEKAAMEAYCLGASPASAEVDASSHWPMQGDWLDAIGSSDLTASGSPSFVTEGADLVVDRDVTSDSTNYPDHYAANVKGGASFNGSNYLSNGSWVAPSGKFVTSLFVRMPDATPAASVVLWDDGDGTSSEYRRIYVSTTGGVVARSRTGAVNSGDASLLGAIAAADTWYFVAVEWDPTGTEGRTLYVAPVGGALDSATNAGTGEPSTDRLYLGTQAHNPGTLLAESGTIIADVRATEVANLAGTVAEYLRERHRNWKASVTPTHQWRLDGDALDTGSAASADLTWSASAAYADELVVSSHYHALGGSSAPTWVASEPEFDGSANFQRIANAFDADTPLVVTARVEPDTVAAGVDCVFSATDGTDAEQIALLRSADDVIARTVDASVTDDSTAAAGLAANTAATAQGEFASTTSRTASIDGTDGTPNTDSSDPAGLDRMSWGRLEGATPGSTLDGTLTRRALTVDTGDNADARTWCEA